MKFRISGKRIVGVVLWALLVAAVAGVMVLGSLKPRAEQSPETEEKAVVVRAITITPETLPDTLTLLGRVEAAADVVLSAEKAGPIVGLSVERGDRVTKGQQLLAVDDALWQAILRRAEIEVHEAEKDLARWERLKQTGAVSESDFDAIRTRVELGRVALDEARTNVKKCLLVAPVSGQVDERFVDEGEYVNEGQPVLRIVDTSSLKVTAEVPERDIVTVRLDQEVSMRVATLDDLSVTGRVSFVSDSGRMESNCFPIELVVDSPPARLKPGMIVELVHVRRMWDDAVVLPLDAVVPRKGDHIAFVVENVAGELRAAPHVVRIARILGDRALIESGVAVGDRLVVAGQRTLQDGQLVELAGD